MGKLYSDLDSWLAKYRLLLKGDMSISSLALKEGTFLLILLLRSNGEFFLYLCVKTLLTLISQKASGSTHFAKDSDNFSPSDLIISEW